MIVHAAWHEALRDALARGERAVLVTVAGAQGSTPREAGAAMVVTGDGIAGTIGGGHLEFEACRLAREALRDQPQPAQWLVRFPLAARLGQCCGGVATLAFAVVDASAASWLDVVSACDRAATPHAIVGRIAPGADAAGRLVVTADDARGTLGDAALDSAAVAECRARLALPAGEPRSASALLEARGATLFVHVERPASFDVRVFGNGHVGRALVQVLGALPADITWIDTREHDFPAQPPANVRIVATDAPQDDVMLAPRGAYVIVMTHSHPLDFAIVEAALGRDDWRYLGLIGSKSKRAQFERRLIARGLPPEALDRLTCPIGAGALRSKEPGVIAVAVAAEMLAARQAARIDEQPPQGRLAGAGAGWPRRR